MNISPKITWSRNTGVNKCVNLLWLQLLCSPNVSECFSIYWISATIRCTADWESGVSRHHGPPIKDPPLKPTKHASTMILRGLREGPIMCQFHPHYVNVHFSVNKILGHTEKTIFLFPFTLNGIWSWWQFSFRFSEPKGIPFGSKSEEKLSPRSYPIQCERKWEYSFLSAVIYQI